MATLDERDFRAALEFVRECEVAPDLPAYRKAVMGLREHVDGHVIAYNEVDLPNERVIVDLEPEEVRFEGDAELFGRLAHEHPVISHISETGDLTPRALSDFMSAEELHALDLYQQVYKPMGLEDQIAVGLPSTADMVLGVAIGRRERGFSDRDRAFLELISPHVGNAYVIARARTTVGEAVGDPAASLDLVVLDGEGMPESTCGRAMELLELYFAASGGGDGALPRKVFEYVARERARVGSPRGLEAPPVELTARREGAHVRGRLIPGRFPGEGDVLMLVEEADPLSIERLREFGITPREADVLQLVAQGRTNADIARELYLSPSTVKRHLEKVYDRVGERSRTAVVARFLRS